MHNCLCLGNGFLRLPRIGWHFTCNKGLIVMIWMGVQEGCSAHSFAILQRLLFSHLLDIVEPYTTCVRLVSIPALNC